MTATTTSIKKRDGPVTNGERNGNGKKAMSAIERAQTWVLVSLLTLLVGAMVFTASLILDHTADGEKHENQEQKSNRITVAVDRAIDGKVPPPEVKEALRILARADIEQRAEMARVREANLQQNAELKEKLGDMNAKLARIEALLERDHRKDE